MSSLFRNYLKAVLLLMLLIPIPLAAQVSISIHELQGTGSSSPYDGQVVRVEGIVTAIVPNGCFIQLPDTEVDTDPLTSEGVFVYTGGMPSVSPGDRVRVTGDVSEYFDLTEIGGSVDIEVLSSGHDLPVPVLLDETFPSPDQEWPCTDLERVEGMLVSMENGTVCSAVDSFDKIYVTAKPVRSLREPGIPYPGESGLPVWDHNPEMFQMIPNVPAEGVIGGAPIVNAWGPLSYSYGEYLLIASQCELGDWEFPSTVRERNAGEVLLATQNALQLNDGSAGYADKLSKISGAVRNLMHAPDIVGFQEVSGGNELADVADQLELDDAGLLYDVQYLSPNYGSGIGFLVRDNVHVDNLIQIQKDDTFAFDRDDDGDQEDYTVHDRPPLLMECTVTSGGNVMALSVVLVHLKAMIDVETDPWVREKRNQQAYRLSQYLNQYQVDHPERPLLVMGDFNAFPFTDGYVDVMGQITGSPDPLGAMLPASDEVNPDLINLIDLVPESIRYTFVHEGTAQVLDQVLVSTSGEVLVRDVGIVHCNGDAPESMEDDPSTPAGFSDHDGVVVFLAPSEPPVIETVFVDGDNTIHVTATDPDGGEIDQYRWKWEGVDIRSTRTRTGVYQPPFRKSGDYVVSVQAMDDEGDWSEPETVNLSVNLDVQIVRPLPILDVTGTYSFTDYLINRGDELLPVRLQPYDDEGTKLDPVDVNMDAGGKLWLNDPVLLPEGTIGIDLETTDYVPLLTELVSNTAHMISQLDCMSTNKAYVPHIAENVEFWDTKVFLSSTDTTGAVIEGSGQGQLTVSERAFLVDVESLLEDPINTFDAWAVAVSPQAVISGFELFVKEGNDGAATELIDRPSQNLFIPHVPTNTTIFWTGFAFLNTGIEPASLQCEFYSDSGERLGTTWLDIPAGAKIKGLMTDLFPDVAGTAGWGLILADQPIIGIELYGTYQAGICGFTLPDISGTDLILPSLLSGEGLWTGVAVANPMNVTASVTFQLVASDGTVKEEKETVMDPYSRFAFVVADFFEGTDVLETDYVRVLSDQPLTAVEAGGDLDRTFMNGLASGR